MRKAHSVCHLGEHLLIPPVAIMGMRQPEGRKSRKILLDDLHAPVILSSTT
jgi:hypothetical protein